MIYISKELIEEELKEDKESGFVFRNEILTEPFIHQLFKDYYTVEMCENFYDSEPKYDQETFNMHMDYNDILNNETTDNFTYSKTQHSKDELKIAYETILKMRENYEPERVEFCNWQESYHKGNWKMTQKHVDTIAKSNLIDFIKSETDKTNRVYFADKDNEIRLFLYMRDYDYRDLWFIFKRR